MLQLKPITLIVGIFFTIAVSALRLMATPPSNTVCQASGGCSFPCSSSQNGQSSNLISASQLAQCSPENLSNCPSSIRLRAAILRPSKIQPTTITIIVRPVKRHFSSNRAGIRVLQLRTSLMPHC
jgi:hypothetical protein